MLNEISSSVESRSTIGDGGVSFIDEIREKYTTFNQALLFHIVVNVVIFSSVSSSSCLNSNLYICDKIRTCLYKLLNLTFRFLLDTTTLKHKAQFK